MAAVKAALSTVHTFSSFWRTHILVVEPYDLAHNDKFLQTLLRRNEHDNPEILDETGSATFMLTVATVRTEAR